MNSSLSPESSGSSSSISTQRSLSPLPPAGASIRPFSGSPRVSRRSQSPFLRDRSDSLPVEPEMNRSARFVANIGEGLKKVFGKKEPKASEREDIPVEDVSNQTLKTPVEGQLPCGVLDEIQTGIMLRKRATTSDLKAARGKSGLSVDRSVSYDPTAKHPVENSDPMSTDEADQLDSEVQAAFDRDETDGLSDMELQQKRQMEIDHLNNKIKRVTEDMRREQTAHHERLKEYLRVSEEEGKDKIKLKARFEAQNAKSVQALDGMKKKLEKYQHQKKELEEGRVLPKRMLVGLKGVKDGIIDGLTRGWEKGASGISGAVNLIRRGRMSGSATNIPAAASETDLTSVAELDSEERPPGAAVGRETAETANLSDQPSQDQNQVHLHTMILQLKAEVDQLSGPIAVNNKADISELQSHHDRMSEILHQLQADVKHSEEERHLLQQRLDSEASHRERVEEQYIELCTSISGMQQEFQQMQERLERIEYQTDERFSETDERLGSLDNKLCQFKNDLALDNLDGSSGTLARSLLSKCLSFLLTLAALFIAIFTGFGQLLRALNIEQPLLPRVCIILVCGSLMAYLFFLWV